MMAVCRQDLSEAAVKDVFVLSYDRMRRYEGTWHMEKGLLFPSYVFLESDNEELLLEELCKTTEAEGQKNGLFPIGMEEENFLKKLCGESYHLKMSRGVIRKGNMQIMEGPLKGMENRIRRIDRHKRLAKVGVIMKPDCHSIPAGLEITEKTV